MTPFLLLLAPPFVATDAGLSWSFDGTVRKEKGRYVLTGKPVRGEVVWFSTPQGKFSSEELYGTDTARTKEADAATAFKHVRRAGNFAGMASIESDQTYRWNGAAVVSRCVYCASGGRAWVVRLWWPASSPGWKIADGFVRSVKTIPVPPR